MSVEGISPLDIKEYRNNCKTNWTNGKNSTTINVAPKVKFVNVLPKGTAMKVPLLMPKAAVKEMPYDIPIGIGSLSAVLKRAKR